MLLAIKYDMVAAMIDHLTLPGNFQAVLVPADSRSGLTDKTMSLKMIHFS